MKCLSFMVDWSTSVWLNVSISIHYLLISSLNYLNSWTLSTCVHVLCFHYSLICWWKYISSDPENWLSIFSGYYDYNSNKYQWTTVFCSMIESFLRFFFLLLRTLFKSLIYFIMDHLFFDSLYFEIFVYSQYYFLSHL